MEIKVRSFRNIFLSFFFVFFLVFFLLQVLAPLFLPAGSITDLSGMTAVSDNEEKIRKMPQPWNFIYGIGDRMCHQKSDRSFFINNNQMPFCARCTAIWLGLVIGIFIMFFLDFELNEKTFLIIVLGIIPLAIDGAGQLIGLWESTNVIRFLTGFLTGAVSGVALWIIIYEFSDILSIRKMKK